MTRHGATSLARAAVVSDIAATPAADSDIWHAGPRGGLHRPTSCNSWSRSWSRWRGSGSIFMPICALGFVHQRTYMDPVSQKKGSNFGRFDCGGSITDETAEAEG